MKIKLYDYDNKVSEFDLGRDDVASIHVCVLSGDEVATVVFSDGSTQKYDVASIHVCVLSGDEVATVVFSDGST